MIRRPAPIFCALGLVGVGSCGPAWAERLDLVPFVELNQIGSAQLSGTGEDSVTYTELAAGLAARTNTRRIVATLTYRFSYRIPESRRTDKSTQHDGAGRMQMMLIKNVLTLDGGVLATQSRVDPGGAAPQFTSVNNTNLTQTYAFYAQPTMTHHIGDLDMVANYRFGYTKNDGKTSVTQGQPVINRFDSSTTQDALLQTGMKMGTLPFEWTVGGHFQREDTRQLDQRFQTYNLVADIKIPVAETIALAASGGYESNRDLQGVALVDPVTGATVTNANGDFIVDHSQPRKLIYDTQGLIGDAGIIWRPSHRTRLEARIGHRYGGLTYSGLLEMKPNEKSGLTVVVSDKLSSFGRAITSGLAGAPLQFETTSPDPVTSYQTCLFGKQGTGACIGGATGQASASAYRDRSASLIYTYAFREMMVNVNAGYTRRTYIDDPTALISLAGVVDQIYYFGGSLGRKLTRDSSMSFAFTGNLYKNGLAGAADVSSFSLSSGYTRTFGRGLQANASLGLDYSKQDGSTADITGRAQLGLHYGF